MCICDLLTNAYLVSYTHAAGCVSCAQITAVIHRSCFILLIYTVILITVYIFMLFLLLTHLTRRQNEHRGDSLKQIPSQAVTS